MNQMNQMNKMKATKAKLSGYGLIIDKNGMPCIQNPLSVPDDVWNCLTDEQRQHANSDIAEEFKRIN